MKSTLVLIILNCFCCFFLLAQTCTPTANACPGNSPNCSVVINGFTYPGYVQDKINDFPDKTSNSYCNKWIADDKGYYIEECVSYAAWRNVPSTFYGGNARNWDDKAIKNNYVVDYTPLVGAIAHWNTNEKEMSEYGHVAVVEEVYANGTVKLSEYNYPTSHVYNSRTIQASQVGRFIHFNDGAQWPTVVSKPMSDTSERIPPPIFVRNGAIFYWMGPASSSESNVKWRFQIIKLFGGDESEKFMAECIVPTNEKSIYIKNNQLMFDYRDNGNNIITGSFVFEEGQQYAFRIFNGREFYYGQNFTYSYCPQSYNHTNSINKYCSQDFIIRSGGDVKLTNLYSSGNVKAKIYIPSNAIISFANTTNSGAFRFHELSVVRTIDPCWEGDASQRNLSDLSVAADLKIPSIENTNTDFELSVFPNPASSDINFHYKLAGKQKVKIAVYNVFGQELLLLNEEQEQGIHEVRLNFNEIKVHSFSGSMLFYSVQNNSCHTTGKIIVSK